MNESTALVLVLPMVLVSTYLAHRSSIRKPALMGIAEFFFAGGAIGKGLTRSNAFGSNLALANTIWFFTVIGYQHGFLTALLVQIPWCISIALVGVLLPTILQAAKQGHTIHGFLGSQYNSMTLRKLAGLATATGYVLNFGFECYVSSEIISSAISSHPLMKWIALVLLAGSVIVYIGIAGFLGNVKQDRTQNRIGLITLLAFSGAVFYTVYNQKTPGASFTSLLAIDISVYKLLGIASYCIVFNAIDVANWQCTAANYRLSDSQARGVRTAWYYVGFAALLPALLGSFLGYSLRSQPGIADAELFSRLFELFLPGLEADVRAIFIGLTLGGFFVLAVSYAENLLSAAQLTLVADVVYPSEFDAMSKERLLGVVADEDGMALPPPSEMEQAFVRRCQKYTFVFAILAVLCFCALADWVGKDNVFNLQFAIFGAAISLAPSVFWMAGRQLAQRQSPAPAFLKVAACCSVFGGYLISTIPLWASDDRLIFLAPTLTLFVSFVSFFAIKRIGRSCARC